MRLIDLDQTIFVPIVDESHGGATYEMQMTIGEMFEKFLDGYRPEVVDAVPVDWLKGLMLSTEDDVDKVEFEWIMREWQKEQEVK